MRKVYSPADHQQAFEHWYEFRNLVKTAEMVGCEYTTILDWKKDTYTCRNHCPWHGWDRLAAQRQAAAEARFQLLANGNIDPLVHSTAIMEAVEKKECETPDSHSKRLAAVETLVRSDLERISHFELLYGKVFQQITGMTLDHGGIHDLPAGCNRLEQLKLIYNNGSLKIQSVESAVKVLIQITEHIKKLQEDLGVKKHHTRVETVETEETEQSSSPELSIEELRRFRAMVEHTPPEKIEHVKQIMKSDDIQVEIALGEQPALPPPPPPPPELVSVVE